MSKWGRHGALTHPAWISPPPCPPVPETRMLKTTFPWLPCWRVFVSDIYTDVRRDQGALLNSENPPFLKPYWFGHNSGWFCNPLKPWFVGVLFQSNPFLGTQHCCLQGVYPAIECNVSPGFWLGDPLKKSMMMDTVTHGGSETWHLLGPFVWVSASIPSSHAFHLVCPQGPRPALNVAWLAVFPLTLLAIKFPWVPKLTISCLPQPLGVGRWQSISWMHMYFSSWSRMVAWYLESLLSYTTHRTGHPSFDS